MRNKIKSSIGSNTSALIIKTWSDKIIGGSNYLLFNRRNLSLLRCTGPSTNIGATFSVVGGTGLYAGRYNGTSRWYSAGSTGGSSSNGKPTEEDDDSFIITVQEPEKPTPSSIPADFDRSKFTHEIKFKFPDMGGDGRVTKWFKKEGDIIQRKDVLCEIELEVCILPIQRDIVGKSLLSPPNFVNLFIYLLLLLFLQCLCLCVNIKSFSFTVDSDDEGITIMGELHIPEDHTEPVKPGTVLCTILHPEEPSLVQKTKE